MSKIDERRLEKLKQLLSMLNDGLSKEEFVKSFEAAVKLILKTEKNLVNTINKLLSETISKIEKKHDILKQKNIEDLGKMQSGNQVSLNNILSKINSALREQENGMNFIRDKVRKIKVGSDGANGLDGQRGADGKNGSPDTAETIRNKIKLLQGEERFDLSVIKGLRGILDRLDKRPTRIGGGFSKIHMEQKFIDDETPSGTVNGTNKNFDVANIPNPTASLKVFVNGMRMRITEDYTFSGRRIVFTTAPPTNSVVLVDYRK